MDRAQTSHIRNVRKARVGGGHAAFRLYMGTRIVVSDYHNLSIPIAIPMRAMSGGTAWSACISSGSRFLGGAPWFAR